MLCEAAEVSMRTALICIGLLIGCGGEDPSVSTSSGLSASGAGGAGGAGGQSSSASSSGSSTGGGNPQGGACDDAVSPDPDIQQALPKQFVDTSLPMTTGKML